MINITINSTECVENEQMQACGCTINGVLTGTIMNGREKRLAWVHFYYLKSIDGFLSS